MSIFGASMTGYVESVDLLGNIAAYSGPMLGRVLREEADAVFRQSQVQVPFRTGALKASGRVDGPIFDGDWKVDISYGNTAIAYAMYQHEGMRQDGSHIIRNYHNGKKGHYLSDPMNDAAAQLGAILAARLEEMFGGRFI